MLGKLGKFPSPYGARSFQTDDIDEVDFEEYLEGFRPLTGRGHFKPPGAPQARTGVPVSVPLRGEVISNTPGSCVFNIRPLGTVSVPLRGEVISNSEREERGNWQENSFPSPYGARSFQTTSGSLEQFKDLAFPSPYGARSFQTLCLKPLVLPGL